MGVQHEAWIEVGCPACGGRQTTSVYWARRHQEIKCPGCGATIGLSSEAFQSELDRAEHEWLAAWEEDHPHVVGES